MDSEDFQGISGILIESTRFIVVNSVAVVSVMKLATTFYFMIMATSPRTLDARLSTYNFKVGKVPRSKS